MHRLLLALSAWLVASSSWIATRVHVVTSGESLITIARRYHVRVDDLRVWNDLSGDTIRIGQGLRIDPDGRYRVVAGDTLSCIAVRHRVSVEHLEAENPELRSRGLEVGMELVVPPRPPSSDGAPTGSHSIGSPMCGSLEGGARLGAHPAFVLRNPERAYATERTIARLRSGFDALLQAEPRAPRVRVHDLSLPGGGPIDDHRTHQSGRDVDITYYQRSGCGPEGCPLRPVAPAELDARRQWRLLHHWLSRGEIDVIYVDYSLQGQLHAAARRAGASEEELAEWLQYPRGPESESGRIRHFPNHVDHVHVRFACHPSERRCE